ncbi:MAG: GntR family transcriptional regulator [Mariniphaga sp.]|nr:GntR family transcriptional regulator [Mariniphaga sp.]
MVEVGKTHSLKVKKIVDFGVYLDAGDEVEILLPLRYVPEGVFGGDEIEVFVYYDSEDRLIATTEKPFAQVGQFAFLKCVAVTNFGAFLDWGLMKDLLVPFREQRHKLEEGKSYVVFVYMDLTTKRIVASAKVDKFLDNLPVEFEPGEEVDLIIYGESDLGYKAIVDDVSSGILYKNEVFQTLEDGQQLKGYIKKVREDDKIDLMLHKPGHEKLDSFSEQILDYIKANDGKIKITDKSSPDEIYSIFNISKKNFKKAIGGLYKKKLIVIEEDGIRLNK